ncbi:MAG: C25 family cysteine peptidase [Candidatus Alcyoniella australis]|nr:C25 family cysteine peptidase [Candidatus Alcyoniella australis]
MRRLLLLTALIATLSVPAAAATINLSYSFTEPQLHFGAQGVELESQSPMLAVPGRPAMPVRTVYVALPPQSRLLSVRVTPGDVMLLEQDLELAPVGALRKLCGETDATPGPRWRDPAVYLSQSAYPGEGVEVFDVQRKLGVQILPLRLQPTQYEPLSGRLTHARQMDISIETAPRTVEPIEPQMPFRGSASDLETLARLVDNPSYLALYAADKSPTEEYEYVILCPASFAATMQTLADFKAAVWGLSATVYTLTDVEANYSGADLTAKVRAFAQDIYANWGTRFLLIVGDVDGSNPAGWTAPMRMLWVTGIDPDGPTTYTETVMASDLYFGCLDGSYNFDGDDKFGEPTDGEGGGEVDLMYELSVGRIAADTVDEANNQIAKIMGFEQNGAPRKVMLVGETLDSYTSGGDIKNLIHDHMDEVDATRLYSDLGTLSYSAIVNNINSNEHQWVNHCGHSNVTSNMSFYTSDVYDLTNTTYYLGWSHGCYAGSIDSRSTYGGYYSGDCIVEYFTDKTGAGAFAYIANSRYGFYLEGRLDGPSSVYDWTFADALFTEDIHELGAAHDYSREANIALLDPNTMMRYQMYELLLFGDPQTPMLFDCDWDDDGVDGAQCDGLDCDDRDALRFPGNPEQCDGIDNDCDGAPGADEVDLDLDGFMVCQDDCDDGDAAINPDADEVCDDGVDNNCNGEIDEGCGDDDDDDSGDDDVGGDDDDDDDSCGCQ